MFMPMMDIWKMRMSVRHRLMAVWMDMGFFAVPSEIMRVLVMLIMAVRMRMRHHGVGMLVRVFFR